MWISNNISKPLRKGYYKTLVDFDGLGNLAEFEGDYFDGKSWDLNNSSIQFIIFWWAEKEDYEVIRETVEKEMALKSELRTIHYKGSDITYKHTFYFDGREGFTTTELDEENMKEIDKEYKNSRGN